jgi:alkylated DNA repair dioxygenase AlkB
MNASLYSFEKDCYAMLVPNFINDRFDELLSVLDFEEKIITMFGKKIPLPRLTSYYSTTDKPYKYSGISNSPFKMIQPLSEIIEGLRVIIPQLVNATVDTLPNSCFINYYRNGNDYIGWHSDDELESFSKYPIYSISFGDTRIFEIRKGNNSPTKIPLTSGSLLIMYGSQFQKLYQHRVPKSDSGRHRLNLTFRSVF